MNSATQFHQTRIKNISTFMSVFRQKTNNMGHIVNFVDFKSSSIVECTFGRILVDGKIKHCTDGYCHVLGHLIPPATDNKWIFFKIDDSSNNLLMACNCRDFEQKEQVMHYIEEVMLQEKIDEDRYPFLRMNFVKFYYISYRSFRVYAPFMVIEEKYHDEVDK